MNNNRLIKGFTFDIEDPYFTSIIDQIPRLLSLMDRNPASKSYGCFDRNYWLYKAIDFPSANIQFSTLALAYLYKYNFEGSKYYENKQLLLWIEAAMNYWTKIQHSDGSFDEFYPNERGWGAPTGFTCYSMGICMTILDQHISSECKKNVLKSLNKGIKFLNKYDGDKMLTNHHAITILAINTVFRLTNNKELLIDLNNKINILIDLHNDEGWSKEYDGPDLGYLSATVSFLSKSQLINYDDRIQSIINSSIEFITYFAQPDGGFGGIISSRNTVHVYPDGFEINKNDNEKSQSLCEHFTKKLVIGNTAIPIIMPDRYLGYRVVEFIETAMSKKLIKKKNNEIKKLPYQKKNFTKIFNNAGILVRKIKYYYVIINLSKGGAIKIFDVNQEKVICSDSGITVCAEKESFTSSWIDPNFDYTINEDSCHVNGRLVQVVSPYQFTIGMIIFRLIQLTFGQISIFAYYMKILIKKIFISGIKRSKINFSRKISILNDHIIIKDILKTKKRYNIDKIIIGGELHFRYVPQSRYFLENDTLSGHFFIKESDKNNIYNDSGLINKRKFELDN